MKSIAVKIKFLGIICRATNTKSVIVNLNHPFIIEHLISSLEKQFTSLSDMIRDFDGNFVIYFINPKGRMVSVNTLGVVFFGKIIHIVSV